MATQNIYNLTDTWNAGGTTFTAIKMNVTDTASAAASLLMDLQVGAASKFKVDKAGAVTLAGSHTVNGNGALSAPGLSLTGTWITGGTATTTKPYVLVETAGATSTAWSTSGTGVGINAASGFAGNLVDFQLNGTSIFKVSAAAAVTLEATGGAYNGRFFITNNQSGAGLYVRSDTSALIAMGTSDDCKLSRKAAANWQLGAGDAASAVAQSLSVQSVVAGTSNTAGTNWTLQGSRGTGTGAGGSIIFQVAPAGGSGTSQNALSTVLTLDSTLLATFGGGIRSAAPEGGTAATWKLGIAASVSPTSPNRTIELDIGGTIYYIAAKTTND